MMRKRLIAEIALFLAIIVNPCVLWAQMDADACHFWNEYALYNPGDVKPYDCAFLLMRGQQIGFDGQPFSVNAVGSMYFDKFQKRNKEFNLHSQIGAHLIYDHAGYTSTGKANLKYAYCITDDEHSFFVNFGLSAGVSFFYYDNSKVTVDNTIDEVAYDDKENTTLPNFNFGVEFIKRVGHLREADRIVFGGSMINMEDYFNMQQYRNTINSIFGYASYRHHGKNGFARGQHRFDFNGGYMINYYDKNRLQNELHGAAIITQNEGGIGYDKVVTGISYRHTLQGYGNNDMTFNVGSGIRAQLYIGHAFDLVLKTNVKRPFSTHELFIRYTNITTTNVRCKSLIDGLQYTQW
ncbi:MAG: type IX secretion system membrane protein PorP/SprF [Paludibacteraceae bacterium]|nr:type IX secretion system membrane protein PorP/SprF [Paludibacteraceae bacterium]